MSRARRLAEIAKANEPAFSGTQWWLADPSAKSDPDSPPAPPEPPKAAEPVPAGVAVPAAETQAQLAVSEKQLTIVEAAVPHAVEPSSVPFMATSPLNLSGQGTSTEPGHSSGDLVTRLSGLKEKFLGLGRKSRAAQSE